MVVSQLLNKEKYTQNGMKYMNCKKLKTHSTLLASNFIMSKFQNLFKCKRNFQRCYPYQMKSGIWPKATMDNSLSFFRVNTMPEGGVNVYSHLEWHSFGNKKKKILSLKLPRNGASTQQTNVKSPLLQITFVTNTIQQSVAYELEFCKNWQNIIKQAPGFVHEVDKRRGWGYNHYCYVCEKKN